MPDEKRTSELLLKSSADTTGFSRTQLELGKLRGEIDFTKQLAKQVTIAAPQMGEAIAKGAQTGSKELFRLKTSFEQVKQAAIDAKNAALDSSEPLNVLGGGGVRRGFSETLRFLGREGRALPSQQIPGLGIGTDAISKIIGLIGTIPPVAFPAIAAIGGVVVALKLLSDRADRAAQAESELLAAEDKRVTQTIEIRDKVSNSSSEVLAKEFENLYAEQTLRREQLAAAIKRKEAIDAEFAALGSSLNIGARSEIAARGLEAQKEIDRLTTIVGEYRDDLTVTSLAMQDSGLAARELAEAEAKLATERAKSLVTQQSIAVRAQVEAANLAATGTEKQVQDRLDALAREKQVLLDNLPIMQKNLEQADEGSDAQKAFQAQIDSTRQRLLELDTTMLTLAGDTLQAAKANDLATEAEKKRTDAIKAVQKYNQDVLKIDEQFAQKEIDLANKLADQQIAIAEKAAEDAEKLLAKLEEQLADLETDLGRDLDKDTRKANFDALQEQIRFQRNEAAETQRHLDNLDRIRRQAQQDEFELGLDRDFAGLARSRRQTAQQIAEANIQFNQDRQARLDAFKAKLEDERAQFEFERQERIIQFQQDVIDARAQYTRERLALLEQQRKQYNAARDAYTRDLALLRSKHDAELKARDAEIRAELSMIQAGNAAKLQLESSYYQQSIAILQNAVANVGGASSASANAVVSGSSNPFTGIFGATAGGRSGGGRGTGATVTLSIPISISTGASAAQVQAIAPQVQNIVHNEVSGILKQIFGD